MKVINIKKFNYSLNYTPENHKIYTRMMIHVHKIFIIYHVKFNIMFSPIINFNFK